MCTAAIEKAINIINWFMSHSLANEKLKMKVKALLKRVYFLVLPVSNRCSFMADAICALLEVGCFLGGFLWIFWV